MQAGQAGGGWEMLQEHRATPCHRHPIQLGQAGPNWGCKGDKLPLLVLLPRLGDGKGCKGLGHPTAGSRSQQWVQEG